MLVHVFVRRIEKQLVVILVEARTRNDHRTADVAAGIVETVVRRGRSLAVVVPSVTVQYAVARVEVALSVEVSATALAYRLEGDRPLRSEERRVGKECRSRW